MSGSLQGDEVDDAGTTALTGYVPFKTDTVALQFENQVSGAFDPATGSKGTPSASNALQDCAKNGNTPWYPYSLPINLPSAAVATYPWEYFGRYFPSVTGAAAATDTNAVNVRVVDLTQPGLGPFATFGHSVAKLTVNGLTTTPIDQCASQYTCVTDIINNCSQGGTLTLQVPCGGNGQQCCVAPGADRCPGDTSASCDWDLVCREGLWPSTLTTTDEYGRRTSEDWNLEIQGLAADGTNWYVVQGDSNNDPRGAIFKVPIVGWDFAATTNGIPTGTVATINNASPQIPSPQYCNHWGDADYYGGQIYVPEENCNNAAGTGGGGPNRIGLFDAKTLNYIGSYALDAAHIGSNCDPDGTLQSPPNFPVGTADCSASMSAPAVAVNPKTGEIYMAGPQIGSVAYSIYVFRPSTPAPLTAATMGSLKLVRVLPLTGSWPGWAASANGYLAAMPHGTAPIQAVPVGAVPIGYCSYWDNWASGGSNCGVQGMAFSPSGDKLYVVDQNQGAYAVAATSFGNSPFSTIPNPRTGGTQINPVYAGLMGNAESNEGGWIHVYQVAPDHLTWERDYPLAIDYADHQEAEGITIVDTTAVGSPRSQIHVQVYKNADAAGDHEMWSHHYNVTGGPF